MRILKGEQAKMNWLQIAIIFILGILVACNIFMFLEISSVKREISKLQADDLALAQAINSIFSQLQAKQLMPNQSDIPGQN